MSAFIDHCNECNTKLGKAYPEVHRWMDEFFSTLSVYHRRKRHHLAGVKECGELFGPDAEKAAELHLKADLKGEGWKDGEKLPENEEDYVNMGLF